MNSVTVLPRTVAIHGANTSAISGTVTENYFRFAASMVQNGWNRLGKPQTIEIR